MSTFRSLLVAGLSLTTVVIAQEKDQRRDPARRDRAGRAEVRTGEQTEVRVAGQESRSSSQLDKHFVSCLRADNKAEVTIATLASQKATNPDVKAFAQQMVKDHSDFLAKLDRFDQSPGSSATSTTTTRSETRESVNRQSDATNRDSTNRDSTNRDSTNRDSTNRDATNRDSANRDNTRRDNANRDSNQNEATNRDSARPREGAAAQAGRGGVQADVNRTDTTATAHTAIHGSGGDIAHQLTQIKQEITDKCVASAQKELNSKQGQEFDKCFVGMQIAHHMHMVDTLSVLSTKASPELQQILDEGLQTSQQHLEHAKQLAKKLEGSSSTSSERSSDRSSNRSENTERNPEKAK